MSAPILKALEAEGYTTPTPIQMQALPIVQKGKDLIGLAQTGTGKTAAFALPILDRLHKDRKHAGEKSCRTLVLAPTRELAAQIAESFRAYGKFLGLSTAVVYGGASMHKQKQAMFRGVDILVATPGRLLDHVSQRSIRLDKVEILVLDEADHMLDMGFIHDLRKIATILPRERQTLFFSATMPKAIEELAAQFLDNPEKVAVTPVSSTAERVQQAVIHVDQSKKQDLLHALLSDKSVKRALVFARTKHGADRIVKHLDMDGIAASAIHGNKAQNAREPSHYRHTELVSTGNSVNAVAANPAQAQVRVRRASTGSPLFANARAGRQCSHAASAAMPTRQAKNAAASTTRCRLVDPTSICGQSLAQPMPCNA